MHGTRNQRPRCGAVAKQEEGSGTAGGRRLGPSLESSLSIEKCPAAAVAAALPPMHRLLLALCCWLVLGTALAQAPAKPLEVAQTHWYANRQTQALEVLTQAIAADPQQSRWRFTLAWMHQERGETAQAELLLQRLIEEFPDFAEAHNNLAVIQAARGDLDAAHQSLTRAVLLNPDHANAQENLGDLLLRLAQRAFARAQGLQPQQRLHLKLSQLDALLRTAR